MSISLGKNRISLLLMIGALFASAYCAFGGDYLRYCIVSSGDPKFPNGAFYGYKSSSTGPGDDAFKKCQALAEEKKMPLVARWGIFTLLVLIILVFGAYGQGYDAAQFIYNQF